MRRRYSFRGYRPKRRATRGRRRRGFSSYQPMRQRLGRRF